MLSRVARLPLVTAALAACTTSHNALELGEAGAARVHFEEHSLSVELEGELVAEIHLTGAQSPYVYPVLGPGGVAMTRGFPMDAKANEARDHPHHRSLWLTHGDVNGWDFWHEGERSGRIAWTGGLRVDSKKQSVAVGMDLAWEAGGEVLLEERRTLGFHADEGTRWIDVTAMLTAARDVTFGDTKEGSMALRLRPELRLEGDGSVARGSMVNSEGQSGRDVWGKRARWVHYSGPVDGGVVGVAILDHPENPRHPTWWHARSYGLVAANPFGVHDFERKPEGTGDLALKAGEGLTLRYRILLHAGELAPAEIEEAWCQYADS